MGNQQHKQRTTTEVAHERKLAVNMYVVYDIRNREYEQELAAVVERMNAQLHYVVSLFLQPKSEEYWKPGLEYLHVVKSFEMTAKLQTEQMQSEIQLLTFLSKTFCRHLSEREICGWFKLEGRKLGQNCTTPKFVVDGIAFGTLENATTFVTARAHRSTSASYVCATSYELEFQLDKKKIRITQTVGDGEQLFSLEVENMHRILHVVRRHEHHLDVYFQLRHPPLMCECINVDAPEQNRRFSRRSYLHGVASEEIGRSDVLRVRFSTSVHDIHLQGLLYRLVEGSPRWEPRFTWIRERATNFVPSVDEHGLNSFAVLYANNVLQSVGLRCQLLLKALPKNLDADVLYSIAEQYESEPEYYLMDINRIIDRSIRRCESNPKPSNGSMELMTVYLTPTRIVFRRPSAGNESNRVFRDYFAGDRAEYVMKVCFRDEDFAQNGAKNLHCIPLLYRNDSLDDQVGLLYAGLTLGWQCGRSVWTEMTIGL